MNASPNSRDLLDWKYSDLKLIDPVDTVEPGQDLIAAYSRIANRRLQLRMDFLELDKYLGQDIYIPIDTNPGGDNSISTSDNRHLESDVKWDYLIKMTGAGGIELIDNRYTIVKATQLYVIFDRDQDRIVIDLLRSNLPVITGQTNFQVIITYPGDDKIADKSLPFSIDTPSPKRVKVVFAFWDTFSSSTPAQTLRSWAGAHAGPMSSRHGLKYLIDAAARTDSTIFLFDLLTPQNISALDYLNTIPEIQKLADKGILGLPGTNLYPGSGNSQIFPINSMRNMAGPNLTVYSDWIANIGITNISSQSVSILDVILDNLDILYNKNNFFGDNDYAHNIDNQYACELLPTEEKSDYIFTNVSLNCKRLFLSMANNQSALPLFFGGDFSTSILGDPSISTKLFSYVAAHPWIQILTGQDLVLPGNWFSWISQQKLSGQNSIQDTTQPPVVSNYEKLPKVQSEVYTSLLAAPKNKLTDLAWQVYNSLSEPGSPEELSLRENYIGQIGEIIAASEWVNAPQSIHTCSLDLDYDGKNECIQANGQIFLVIEPEGGYIPFAFSIDDQGVHQVVGPTWEFIVGLSDPIAWDIESGVRADLEQVLGIFQDQFNNWTSYFVNIDDGVICLYNTDMSMRKSVSITSDTIQIDILSNNPSTINLSIPLVIDPWQRFTPHWGDSYIETEMPFGFEWGINQGVMVRVSSVNQVTGFGFNATHTALFQPEDPNFDYNRGHYLPYPMAMVEIAGSENISVTIVINP